MNRITIKIPRIKENKWSLSFGGSPRLRNSAAVVFNAIERRLLGSWRDYKTCVRIKEWDNGRWEVVNESLASTDANYLIYTMACFLEDYLSEKVMNRVERVYL